MQVGASFIVCVKLFLILFSFVFQKQGNTSNIQIQALNNERIPKV